MRKINIICIGKKQKTYIDEGLAIFDKRLRRYCVFQTVFIKEANYRSGTQLQWLTEEGKSLMKHISPDHYTIVCDEKGTSITSLQLSKKFNLWANNGYSQFDFIIGGAYGLSSEVKTSADLILSLSAMTMTHQLVRLILAEQIYRAFTIIRGEKYHHG